MKHKYDLSFPKAKLRLDVIYYGISLLPYIDKYSNEPDSCKNYFSIPTDKKIIAIGYNAIKQQQHDKVLSEIKKIKNKSNYFLIFQMTYGYVDDKDYFSILLENIKSAGFEYKIITDFLTMDELAKLRIVTDIFINAQTTDAFCNSIKEFMYTKTQIISASWLHYPEIDIFPLYLNEFSDFNEIPALFDKPISEEQLEWNKKKIQEESTWEKCREKWAEIYGVYNK